MKALHNEIPGLSEQRLSLLHKVGPAEVNMREIPLDTPVRELVSERPGRSNIFERFGIAYCNCSNLSIHEACEAHGIKTDALLDDLYEADSVVIDLERDWSIVSLTELCDHIEGFHHKYTRAALARLTALIDKLNRAHSARHPHLAELSTTYGGFRIGLESHMSREEMIVFPLCREIDGAGVRRPKLAAALEKHIRVMIAEHGDTDEEILKLRALTHGFTRPKGACNTYRAMLQAFRELEADIQEHVRLETEILVPRAIGFQLDTNKPMSKPAD